ncbi:ATP-grasp fold amidoligase family protein [Priestia aryabhattai]|uniref:ATP-grasp fold amidoligase family protein n=1 Tax=Priestia aryabhattai TaxID=412384 RepID=UPI003D7F7F31
MLRKLLKAIKSPKLIILQILVSRIFRFIPDDMYLRIVYKLRTNKTLNLKKPVTFNEKVQWLKINDRKDEYSILVDKYTVRNYIADRLGEEYLIPLLGVYQNFSEINFGTLPKRFVLKPTHTSGDVYICKNKDELDFEELEKIIDKWMKKDYFWLHREWPYKNVKPKIICEEYMIDNYKKDLIDYKFMCFNGEVKCVFVCQDRNSSEGLKIDIYNKEWDLLPFQRPTHPNSNKKVEKPKNYKKMIEFAEMLSKEFYFLRVDFYEINQKIYFGELTFYPGAGFEEFSPEDSNLLLGKWINIPMLDQQKI